ncbi:hypothetical protein VNO77_22297 [Canavalia gladiata]|uniref:Uncharacterized protein n=1 Tax=Canavalia gladiata TaxID=3824 RepID=A0AAN9L2B7_CANGL
MIIAYCTHQCMHELWVIESRDKQLSFGFSPREQSPFPLLYTKEINNKLNFEKKLNLKVPPLNSAAMDASSASLEIEVALKNSRKPKGEARGRWKENFPLLR